MIRADVCTVRVMGSLGQAAAYAALLHADGWHGRVEHAAGTPDPAAFPDDNYIADYLDQEGAA